MSLTRKMVLFLAVRQRLFDSKRRLSLIRKMVLFLIRERRLFLV